MAILACTEDNKSYTFKEMTKHPGAADFIQDMLKEVDNHYKRNYWTFVLGLLSLPKYV